MGEGASKLLLLRIECMSSEVFCLFVFLFCFAAGGEAAFLHTVTPSPFWTFWMLLFFFSFCLFVMMCTSKRVDFLLDFWAQIGRETGATHTHKKNPKKQSAQLAGSSPAFTSLQCLRLWGNTIAFKYIIVITSYYTLPLASFLHSRPNFIWEFLWLASQMPDMYAHGPKHEVHTRDSNIWQTKTCFLVL